VKVFSKEMGKEICQYKYIYSDSRSRLRCRV